MTVSRWDSELRASGFSGADAHVLDKEPPVNVNACIISTAVATREEPKQPVTLLYNIVKHSFALELYELLVRRGIVVEWLQLGMTPKSHQTDVISTLDLDGPFLHTISMDDYQRFMLFISELQSGMLWLTRPAQIRCKDPRYGLIVGFGHTIRTELGVEFSTVQLENLNSFAVNTVYAILRAFQSRSLDTEHSFEPDLVFLNDEVYVPRYHWITPNTELQIPKKRENPKSLTFDISGGLDSLYWAEKEPSVLNDGDVEVQTHFVGLNAKVRAASFVGVTTISCNLTNIGQDLYKTTGIIEDLTYELGTDATGVITRVGKAVTRFVAGDKVMLAGVGLFATKIITCHVPVAKIPAGLTMKEAAAFPAAFSTAIYCIIDVGQLRQGQVSSHEN